MKKDMGEFEPELSGRRGQFAFTYKGKRYSIIDLCENPSEASSITNKDWDELMSHYKPYNFEVYDGENCYRFDSLQEAFVNILAGTYNKEEK